MADEPMDARAHRAPRGRWWLSRVGGRREDRGAVLVEFALVFPILMVFLLGTITGGFLMNQRLQLGHAAREAARFGATVPVGQEFASGTWAETVRSVAVERSAGELELADVCVALVEGETPAVHAGSSDYSTNGSLPCMADDGIGDTGLRVQVTVTSTGTLETGLWSREVQIDLEAVARHEEM